MNDLANHSSLNFPGDSGLSLSRADGADGDATPDPAQAGDWHAADLDHGVVELVSAAERMVAAGDAAVALACYETWLRRHPADPLLYVAYFNYGTLLSQTGHPERAALALAESLRLDPSFLPAYVNAGLALERLGRLDAAVGHWMYAAAAVDPRWLPDIRTAALKHLGRVFKSVGEVGRAETALARCLEVDPRQHDVIQHWIAVREMQCKWPVIVPWAGLTAVDIMAALSPLAAAIHTNDPMFQLTLASRGLERDLVAAPVSDMGRPWLARERPAGRRPMRIGYVSPDLREHAIGFLTAEIFELHDRHKVEVFAYYTGRGSPDALQERIKRTVDHWRDIVGWPEGKAAREIVDDEIDILVDLGGHTGDSPMRVFAMRPAPVIVNWLGYPGSMGTAHHQYIIADQTIIPPDHEKYYSERVVRLPCYQPTDRQRICAPSPARHEVGLADGTMVYCCFNGTQKITPATFRRWMRILARVPHSVLWLLSCDAPTDQRLRQQAAAHGIEPERLIFAVRKPNADHLARYPLADLFLDTSPYSAHTTASDSLWMGVPVLTMTGHSFASRVCASLLRSAGLADLVCDNPRDYEDLAVALGRNAGMLAGLRHRLRASRNRCALFDTPLLVNRLEALYAGMWNDYQADRLPEPDLTNFAVYEEIGAKLDHELIATCDFATYERIYRDALARRDAVSPLPADRRLWTRAPAPA